MSNWLVPYFTFDGNCEEAVKFYQSILGGEAQILHFGDAPANPDFPVNEALKNLVLHAELRKDGHVIRFSDNFPGNTLTKGNTVAFSLEFPNVEETRSVFEALAQDGVVIDELQPTFFSPLYGRLTDKFGTGWMVTCQK
jgi:PhnB protein